MRTVKLHPNRSDKEANIHLLLSGFSQQQLISVDDIIQAIKKLPAQHLSGLRKIHYDPSRLQQMLYYYLNIAPNLHSQGEFIQQKRQINIYTCKQREAFFHTLYHEIGHYVYFFIIDSSLKKHWATQLYRKEGYVSNYAKKNAAEDFAESYSAYVLEPQILMPLKDKYTFIRHQVFQRNEPSVARYL